MTNRRTTRSLRPARSVAVLSALCGMSADAQPLSAVRVATLPHSSQYSVITAIAQPPGDTRDLFVTMLDGPVWVVRDGVSPTAPLMDLSGSLVVQDESGLLGLAFHPQFQTNGYLYLCYGGYLLGTTNQTPGVHLVRFTVDVSNPSVLIPGSARHIFYYTRPDLDRHMGGWIGFGPDGYLYVSCGEGPFTQAPIYPSQDLGVVLGKILRLDVDHDDFPADPLANYAIPPSNPFAGSAVARPEIWAYGLRNPWRCSFDRLTGDLWIADVGSAAREELDLIPFSTPPFTAPNFGWPCREGTLCNGTAPGCTCNDPDLVPPIFDYPHLSGGAVIGGYVYRGQAIPALQGAYLFADLTGPIWSLRYGPAGITDFTVRTTELGPASRSTFGEGADGELYYGYGNGTGSQFWLEIARVVAQCPANCDGSSIEPRLNVNDFMCFLNSFARGASYANCDGSTTPPVLTVGDFICFLNEFAAGCP